MTMKNNVYPLPTLEDHLTECESRYQNILERFDQIEKRFNRLDSGLQDIKDLIRNARYKIQ
jgi:archaellum component FlaC